MAVLTTLPADALIETMRREFVPFLREKFRIADYTKPGIMAKGGGSIQLRWLRFSKITDDRTTALTEASASDGEIVTLSLVTVTTSVAEYGGWTKIGSLIDLAQTPETREQYTQGFGHLAAKTMDDLLYAVADDTTNWLNSRQTETNTGTLSITDTATAEDIARISGFFNERDAEEIPNLGMYVVVVHGKVETDLVTDVTTTRLSWSEVNKHVPGIDGQQKIIRGTPGAIYGTMVLRSNNLTTVTVTGGQTAYLNIAFADYGLGRASFDGMTPKDAQSAGPAIMVKRSGSQDTSNPLSMFNTLGFKFNSGQALLDSNRVLRYYTATAT